MNKSEFINSIDFVAMIHTLQIVCDYALLPEEEINAKPYIKSFSISNGNAVYRINPNKYGTEIYSLAEFKQTLSLILDELYITDYYIRRLDFSINTIVTFDEIYKIACYFKELYAVHIREDNSFRTNGYDFKKRSLKVRGTNYELEIYDKNLESKGLDPFNTRIEFRFRRIRKNQSLDTIVNTIHYTLDSLTSHINELNEKRLTNCIMNTLLSKIPIMRGEL